MIHFSGMSILNGPFDPYDFRNFNPPCGRVEGRWVLTEYGQIAEGCYGTLAYSLMYGFSGSDIDVYIAVLNAKASLLHRFAPSLTVLAFIGPYQDHVVLVLCELSN